MNDDILSLLEGLYRAIEAGKVAVSPSEVGEYTYTLQSQDKLLSLVFERIVERRVLQAGCETLHYEDITYKLYQPPAINYTIFIHHDRYEMATKLWKLIESKNPPKTTKDILVIVNSLIAQEPQPVNSVQEQLNSKSKLFTACDARQQTKNAYGTADQLLSKILALINEASNNRLDHIYLSIHCNGSEYVNFKHHDIEIGAKLQQLGFMVTKHDNKEYPVTYTISWT